MSVFELIDDILYVALMNVDCAAAIIFGLPMSDVAAICAHHTATLVVEIGLLHSRSDKF